MRQVINTVMTLSLKGDHYPGIKKDCRSLIEKWK